MSEMVITSRFPTGDLTDRQLWTREAQLEQNDHVRFPRFPRNLYLKIQSGLGPEVRVQPVKRLLSKLEGHLRINAFIPHPKEIYYYGREKKIYLWTFLLSLKST